MKTEIATLWTQALLSGDYSQAQKQLRKDDSFCCLGVLCDLFKKETKTGEWELSLGDDYFPFVICGDSST